MQEFLSHLDGKKIALITIVLVGIVGLFVILSTAGSQSTSAPKESKVVSKPTPKVTPAANSLKDLLPQAYLSDTFVVYYPGDWKGKKQTLIGGEQVAFMADSTGSQTPPSITVTNDTNTKTVEERAKYFTSIGFQRGTMYVGARQWVKVSGSVPEQNIENSHPAQTMYETDLFTTYQGQTYTISYKYVATHADPTIERIFNNILSSFEFF